MNFREALCILLVGLYLFACPPASADDLTPLQARSILAVAYGQYHGPPELMDNPPKIHFVSEDGLRAKYGCRKQDDGTYVHCPAIRGLYDDEAREIYLVDGLDFSTVYATTVLLHEYIHYFQDKKKGRVKDLNLSSADACLEIVAREQEAYRIQWEVLLKAGDYVHAQSVRMVAGMVHC